MGSWHTKLAAYFMTNTPLSTAEELLGAVVACLPSRHEVSQAVDG